MEIITKSAEDTKRFGQEIGSGLAGGELIALIGDLGSGKTTFMQGLAEGLQIKNKVISPTFILLRTYEVGKEKIKNLYHLDLYRLENNIDEEIKNLGVDDLWGREENIVVIEWADRAKEILPTYTKWIEFEDIGEGQRKITL